jgi:hypothetical protein
MQSTTTQQMDVPAASRPTATPQTGVMGIQQDMVDAESALRFQPFDFPGVMPVIEGSDAMRVGLSSQTTREYEMRAQQSNLNNQQRVPDGPVAPPLTPSLVVQRMTAAGVPTAEARAYVGANPGADPEVLLALGLNPQNARNSVVANGDKLRELQQSALLYRQAVADVVRQGQQGPAGYVGGAEHGPLLQQGNAYLNALQQPGAPSLRAGGSINSYGGIAAYAPGGMTDTFGSQAQIAQERAAVAQNIAAAQMSVIDPDEVPVEDIDNRYQIPVDGPQLPRRN